MKDFKKFPYNYFPTCLGGVGGRVKEERKISLHMNFFFEGIPKGYLENNALILVTLYSQLSYK